MWADIQDWFWKLWFYGNQDRKLAEIEYPKILQHPLCLKCSVPMWFVRNARRFDGEHLHFECALCETVTVVPVFN